MMFSGSVYIGEHTYRAASVRIVRLWRTMSARAILLSEKPEGFFDSLNASDADSDLHRRLPISIHSQPASSDSALRLRISSACTASAAGTPS